MTPTGLQSVGVPFRHSSLPPHVQSLMWRDSMAWLAVGLGGALGSMARHAINHITRTAQYPLGTAFVNVSGCLFIGILAGPTGDRRFRGPFLCGGVFLFVGV